MYRPSHEAQLWSDRSLFGPLAETLVNDQQRVPMVLVNTTSESISLEEGTTIAVMEPVSRVCAEAECDSGLGYGEPVVTASVGECELPEHLEVLVEESRGNLTESQQEKLASTLQMYSDVFMSPDGKLGLDRKSVV